MAELLVTDLHYAYPGPQRDWVLQGLSFSIEAGEFVSIMGPSGAGKTTLALALIGIVPQSTGGVIKGQVLVKGLDARRHPVAELATRIGLVFQDPETQFIHLTVEAELAFGLEGLGLPRGEIGQRISWALEQVGLSGLERRSPFELSGGQKQRVAIAAILAMRPGVLVLDEPTASLDPQGARQVFEVIGRLRADAGTSVLMISQDSEQVARCSDRVLAMSQGRLVGEGPPDRFFQDLELLSRIGARQPELMALAACLNRQRGSSHSFPGVEQAYQSLASELERR